MGGACTWSICGFIWRSCLLESPNVFNHEVEWWSHPHLFHHILNQIIAATLNLSFLLHWLDWHPPWALKNCVLMQYLRTSIIAIFIFFLFCCFHGQVVSLSSQTGCIEVQMLMEHSFSFPTFSPTSELAERLQFLKQKKFYFHDLLCFFGVWVPTLHLKYIFLKNRAGRYLGLQTLFFFSLSRNIITFFSPWDSFCF